MTDSSADLLAGITTQKLSYRAVGFPSKNPLLSKEKGLDGGKGIVRRRNPRSAKSENPFMHGTAAHAVQAVEISATGAPAVGGPAGKSGGYRPCPAVTRCRPRGSPANGQTQFGQVNYTVVQETRAS